MNKYVPISKQHGTVNVVLFNTKHVVALFHMQICICVICFVDIGYDFTCSSAISCYQISGRYDLLDGGSSTPQVHSAAGTGY